MVNVGKNTIMDHWRMRKVIKQKITGISRTVIYVLFLIIALLGMFCGMIFTAKVDYNEHTTYHFDNIFLNVVSVLVLIGIFCFIKIKINLTDKQKRIIGILAIVLYTILLFLIQFYLRLAPRADQGKVLEIAKRMTQGDFKEFADGGYMNVYPNQNGFVMFLYVIFKLLPSGYNVLRVINVFATVFVVLEINAITNIMLWEKKKSNCGKISMLFFPLIGYITFLYGTSLGMALSIGGILFILRFLEDFRIRNAVCSAILLTSSVVIKENYLIYVIGCIIIVFLIFVRKPNKKLVLYIFGTIFLVFGSTKIVECSMEHITGYSVSKGTPSLAWVVMGMQEGYAASGWSNGYNLNLYLNNDCDTHKAKTIAQQDLEKEINKKLGNPKKTLLFYSRKYASQWNNPTYEAVWVNSIKLRQSEGVEVKSYNAIVKKILNEDNSVLVYIMDLFQNIIWIGTLLCLVIMRKDIKLQYFVMAIIVIGGFVFHMIWEAKCQYILPYFVLVLPYAVIGWKRFIEIIVERYENR